MDRFLPEQSSSSSHLSTEPGELQEDVAKLIECGFGGDYPADWVAQNLAESNPEIAAMFTYLDARNRASRKSIGYEVHVNEDQALAWLKQNRPSVLQTLNLGDYELARCDSCGRIDDRDTMQKADKHSEMRCEDCQSVTWWVTRNPDTGETEIPGGIHPGNDIYPSMSHALGFIDAPEDDHAWNAAWLDTPLELNQDRTAVRPERSDEPWATLHDRRTPAKETTPA